ncbi:hypothetical protein T12_12798 [Trichinella patagoniensis]|uniref:Uncharacterized protein n=1 Tax=Trichinella patagoniensis TaxID=990121 RepID=A0A0V0ZB74_9BILA|nr:hypothetical protein T12_12798 [Trichinella patagoniensis]
MRKKNKATVSLPVLEDQEGVRARMLPTKRELGKRGGRAGSNRTDDTDAEMNPQVNTSASSFGDDCGSNPVEATNEPALESGSCHGAEENGSAFFEKDEFFSTNNMN